MTAIAIGVGSRGIHRSLATIGGACSGNSGGTSGKMRARAFYKAHEFMVASMNDGCRNEEREPDVLYE